MPRYICKNPSCEHYSGNGIVLGEAHVYADANSRLHCGACGRFVSHHETGAPRGARPTAGAAGGALLGWAVGGPGGAVIGGLIGLLAGAAAEDED